MKIDEDFFFFRSRLRGGHKRYRIWLSFRKRLWLQEIKLVDWFGLQGKKKMFNCLAAEENTYFNTIMALTHRHLNLIIRTPFFSQFF